MDIELLFLIILTAFFGLLLGAASMWLIHRFKVGSYQSLSREIVQKAQMEAEILKKNTELKVQQIQSDGREELEELIQREKKKISEEKRRLEDKEDKVERRMSLVEKKLSEIDKRESVMESRKERTEQEKLETMKLKKELIQSLEKLSFLTKEEAATALLKQLEDDIKIEKAILIHRLNKESEEEAEEKAKSILATVISRLAVPCVSETTVTTLSLPSEEMKGRIIGRDGRNIRSLERETGVNFLIDDSPGVVVISGYDPVRREIAKTALKELLTDGRIHPTRIEEVVEKASNTVNKEIKSFGEDAALRTQTMGLHPELIKLLGKLRYRYSYGQNVLEHSMEVSHLMGIMAEEMGLNSRLARRIGLLHDIGKAASHEINGSHALIGRDLALKYGEQSEVANGIGCHHGEIPPTTVEGCLCSSADAISASRPGARVEALEEYIKRLKRLEEIAFEFPGIEKAYAMQAGREIRVIVMPQMIDDSGIINLARDLSKRIESELSYPGKIKVTVLRESQVVHYAL